VSDESIDQLASRVADLLLEGGERTPGRRIVDARGVAETYGVSRHFVYTHADELGAIRLGSGPRARLRFDLLEVAQRLRARAARNPTPAPPAHARRRSRRRVPAEHLIPYDGM
jgi:hypothetical protein